MLGMLYILFTLLQFPCYKLLKRQLSMTLNRKPLYAHEAAVCGSIVGGVAAALTTPLDVLKTCVVTPRNGFELVHGFFYEFRKDQCLQISAIILCLPKIHQQIIYGISTSSHIIFPWSIFIMKATMIM